MVSCASESRPHICMSATFVLTPGRCGTQWLNQQLRLFTSGAWVCHEPLHFNYQPIENSPSHPLNKNADRLLAHLSSIQNHLREGVSYLECGFPCWRHLSWFKRELGDDVKVIYVHREPVDNAASLLKLNAFVPPLLPHLPEKQLFHPAAPGALLPEYQHCWQQLSPFEKCLYYWAEVNFQASLYQSTFSEDSWLTIPYQRLFSEISLCAIAEFANISFDFHPHMLERVDQYQGMPQSHIDANLLYQHPKIVDVALRLGYGRNDTIHQFAASTPSLGARA
jgi:hypothetical protein